MYDRLREMCELLSVAKYYIEESRIELQNVDRHDKVNKINEETTRRCEVNQQFKIIDIKADTSDLHLQAMLFLASCASAALRLTTIDDLLTKMGHQPNRNKDYYDLIECGTSTKNEPADYETKFTKIIHYVFRNVVGHYEKEYENNRKYDRKACEKLDSILREKTLIDVLDCFDEVFKQVKSSIEKLIKIKQNQLTRNSQSI